MIIELITIAVLVTLSLYDIKTRELPQGLVYSSLIILLVARILAGTPIKGKPLGLYIAFDSLLLAIIAIMAWLGLIGWGDVAALAIVAVATPVPIDAAKIFPPLLLVLIYYVLLVGLLMVATALYNLTFHRNELSKLPTKYKVIYMFIAKPVRAETIMRKPGWWYPLNLCGEYRTSFNIYLDPPDIAKQVRQALSKGCIDSKSIIWVTYGLPGLPLITIAYILTLLVGDKFFI